MRVGNEIFDASSEDSGVTSRMRGAGWKHKKPERDAPAVGHLSHERCGLEIESLASVIVLLRHLSHERCGLENFYSY